MAQPVTLSQVYALDNLKRAWRWLLTERRAEYKNYFRRSYRAYSLAADDNLTELRIRLRSGAYQPAHAVKTYYPQRSGGLRPISLLTVEDQIVYQAFGNIIAEQLVRRVSSRYEKQVFGHLYAGKTSFTFYRDWRRGYREYTSAFRGAYARGLVHTASFDLTACYDTIDHAVLAHFLEKIGLAKEFCKKLCELLSKWTAASDDGPIYHGHGIPQGPMPSGLLSECVLQHLDRIPLSNRESYLRYVDDIRLLATNEKALRKRLFWLDLASKEIGLFPQSSKIQIHEIKDIDSEIRGISHPPEIGTPSRPGNQDQFRRRLAVLSRGYKVPDDTRFKFVLGKATQCAPITRRLLRILKTHPHLFPPVCSYLSQATRISEQASREAIELLKTQDLYQAFTAGLLRALQYCIHYKDSRSLASVARHSLRRSDPELREAAGSCLLTLGALTWKQTKYHVLQSKSWYTRAGLARSLDPALIGDPSYEWLLNELIRDHAMDVALVAADLLLESGVSVRRPTASVNRAAQAVLREAGLVGRVGRATLVADILSTVLGPSMQQINWRVLLGSRYKLALRKLARWSGYFKTDPTAWVNLTDTLNDLVLEQVFQHETGAIGQYQVGGVGSVLSLQGRFAKRYRLFHAVVELIHKKRLESDLSHALLQRTGRATRHIEQRELNPLLNGLRAGYGEVWQLW